MVMAAAVALRSENGGTEAFAARRNRNTEAPEGLSDKRSLCQDRLWLCRVPACPPGQNPKGRDRFGLLCQEWPQQSAGLRAPERSRSNVWRTQKDPVLADLP
jgi:hypothetical protein